MNTNKRNLIALRFLLYLFLLAVPSYFVVAPIGTWLVFTVWALGLVAVVFLSYWPGYAAMLALLAAGTASNSPLILFAPVFCLMLMFVIATYALAKHWEVANELIPGTRENATYLYSATLRRFIRVFLGVTSIVFVLSFAYSVLPILLPTPTEPTTLAIYVAIVLIAFTIVLRLARSG